MSPSKNKIRKDVDDFIFTNMKIFTSRRKFTRQITRTQLARNLSNNYDGGIGPTVAADGF